MRNLIGCLLHNRTMNESNRLGLRTLLGFLILFLAVWIINLIFGVGVRTVLKNFTDSPAILTFLGSTLNFGIRLVVIVYLSALALKWLLRIDPWSAMFPFQSGFWKDFLFGFALAAVAMLIIFAIETGTGWLTVEARAWQQSSADIWLRGAWLALLTNVFVAITEETIYRGYLLTGLTAVWGKWIGLIVMSILFALPHLLVSDAGGTNPLLFNLLLMIPGIVLGLAYLRSGALWLPIGIHLAWNLFQDEILNLTADSAHVIAALTTQQGPVWIVGTDYGVELGLAGIFGMGFVFAGIWLWTRKRYVPDPTWEMVN